MFESKKILAPTNMRGKKIFVLKKFESQKILGSKNFWVQNKFFQKNWVQTSSRHHPDTILQSVCLYIWSDCVFTCIEINPSISNTSFPPISGELPQIWGKLPLLKKSAQIWVNFPNLGKFMLPKTCYSSIDPFQFTVKEN